MPIIEIQGVDDILTESEQVWGCAIDFPTAASQLDVYSLQIKGWILGRTSPVSKVQVLEDDNVLYSVSTTWPRRDIYHAFREVPNALSSGFRIVVNTLKIKQKFQLTVRAMLEDGSYVPIGLIRGQRHLSSSDTGSAFNPLLITTIGRSGSTWLCWLLAQHPQIISYKPFENEPRVISYWVQVLKSLSDPMSYLQVFGADMSDEEWWIGRTSPLVSIHEIEQDLLHWLSGPNVAALIEVAQARIQGFYKEVSRLQGRDNVQYFVEKFTSDYSNQSIIKGIYPQAREVVLIRDPRDIFCSINAYNQKLNRSDFGRGRIPDDEKYLHFLRDEAGNLLNIYRGQSNIHLLRYEDLILQPTETISSLLSYLQLDGSVEVSKMILEKALSNNSLQEFQQFHRTTQNESASIGRWRTDLDEQLQSKSQEIFKDILEGFGYI
jgi:hypothetical protein